MGEAILSGWIASNVSPANAIEARDICVVDPGDDRRAHLESTYGVLCVENTSQAGAADVVVLAVKPQVMMGVLEEISTSAPFFDIDFARDDAKNDAVGAACSASGSQAFSAAQGPLFISIAAGLETKRLLSALPKNTPLVRVMPNMPLMVAAGASGVCGASTATCDQVSYVAGLFGCLGRAVVVEESDMDAVCALSGSGPAYVAAMIEALRDAAAQHGLDAQLAETLALQTVLGTARLIDETDLSVAETREAICSPGGTTLAALDAMNAAGFADVFNAGVAAAVRRSIELGQSS